MNIKIKVSHIETILIFIFNIINYILLKQEITDFIAILGVVLIAVVEIIIIFFFLRYHFHNWFKNKELKKSSEINSNSMNQQIFTSSVNDNSDYKNKDITNQTTEDSCFTNKEEEKQTTIENNKESIIVNIKTCTKRELMSLDGFNDTKAKKLIEDRNNGKMWYDIDTFVQDFGLQPHEMLMIQDRIKFPNKPKNKYGRKLDI